MKHNFRNSCLAVFILIPLLPLQSEEIAEEIADEVETAQEVQSEQEKRKVYFLPALGLNISSNVILYLANRYIGQAHWAQIDAESIKDNFTDGWEWDGDEYFTNQFGHPYQGSIYHSAARANGFTFYESLLFDVFGSATWELILERNKPSMNDLISTTLGGASLGEMFHRLYLEIDSPFAAIVSPADAVNGLITGRRPIRKRSNIYSFDIAFGAGYNYSRQSSGKLKEHNLSPIRETNSASIGISSNIIYGDPFSAHSRVPYNHFELAIYADIAAPFWYDFNIQSDGYIFSYNVLDNEKNTASTGLSLHYDLFTDRHINFFAESLDWTVKHIRRVNNFRDVEFKGHLGAVIFNADNSYFFDGYSDLRQNKNNYGTGVNIKLFVSSNHKKLGKISFNSSIYQIFDVFRDSHASHNDILFLCFDIAYTYPISENFDIGIAASTFRNTNIGEFMEDKIKGTYTAKLFIKKAF